MLLEVNGEPLDVPEGVNTIAELIRFMELVPETMLVEFNGLALHRREWVTTDLVPGGRVELLRVVAGG